MSGTTTYNPGTSLLGGGDTATIRPVMGGGGGGGAHGDPTVSLLSGGDAPIVPVQGGGGALTGVPTQVEVYELKGADSELLKEGAFEPPALPSMNMLQAYIQSASEYWIQERQTAKRIYEPGYQVVRPPAFDKCAAAVAKEGDFPSVNQFFRLAHRIAPRTEQIVVIPAVRGNVALFRDALAYLDTIGLLKEKDYKVRHGVTIVCLAPFYRPLSDLQGLSGEALDKEMETLKTGNAALFSLALNIRARNMGSFFMLADHSPGNLASGCLLQMVLEAGKSLNEAQKNTLVNLLEPTYVVYPFTLKGETDVRTLLFTAAVEGEPFMPESRDKRFKGVLDFVNGEYSARRPSVAISAATLPTRKPATRAEREGDEVVPTNSAAVMGDAVNIFWGGPFAPSPPGAGGVADPPPGITIPKDADPDVVGSLCLRYKGKLEPAAIKVPFFLFPPRTEDGTPIAHPMLIIRLDIDGAEAADLERLIKPMCHRAIEGSVNPDIIKEGFKPTPDIRLFFYPNQKTVPVAMPDGKTYYLRRPKILIDGVVQNWNSQLFTKEEAAFLNAAQLTPEILARVFGPEPAWINALVDFLFLLTASNCFDSKLTSHVECRNARQFIYKVQSDAEVQRLQFQTMRLQEEQLERELQEARVQQMLAARKPALVPGPTDGYEKVDADKFSEKQWGRPDIKFTMPGTTAESPDFYAYILIKKKNTKDEPLFMKYRMTGVTTIEDAEKALAKKIEDDGKKYPDYLFLV